MEVNMENILKQYKLLSCEREIVAFIGRRTAMWAVLQEAYPHLIRAYGNRPVYLRVDWEANTLSILVGVAYPPAQMTSCFAAFNTAFYDGIPEKVQKCFCINKL
jgi:hypothetical protein